MLYSVSIVNEITSKEEMMDIEKQAADEFDLGSNLEILSDIFRILTFLEQRLNQLARKNYHNRSQYPEAFFEMETALHTLRSWAWDWRCFCGVPTYIQHPWQPVSGEFRNEIFLTRHLA